MNLIREIKYEPFDLCISPSVSECPSCSLMQCSARITETWLIIEIIYRYVVQTADVMPAF